MHTVTHKHMHIATHKHMHSHTTHMHIATDHFTAFIDHSLTTLTLTFTTSQTHTSQNLKAKSKVIASIKRREDTDEAQPAHAAT